MGAGTRLPLLAARGGGGGGSGESLGPSQAPGTEAETASQEPPPCFQGMRGACPPQEDRVRPMGTAPSLPPLLLGGRLGQRVHSETSSPFIRSQTFAQRGLCARLSGPQGAATKTLPKCTSTAAGWPEEEGRDQHSPRPQRPEEQAEADPLGKAASPSLTQAWTSSAPPVTAGGGAGKGSWCFLLLVRHLASATEQPQVNPASQGPQAESHPIPPLPRSLWGTLGPVTKASLSITCPALPRILLAPWPDLQAASLLPAIPQADPTAWNAHSPAIS